MIFSASIDIINEIEARFPTQSWNIRGVNIWPLVRIRLGYALGQMGQQNYVAGASPWLRGIGRLAMAYLCDREHNDYPDRRVDAVFLTVAQSRSLLNDHWVDRLCDPIVDILKSAGRDSLVLEIAGGNDFRVPRHYKSHLIQVTLGYNHIMSRFERWAGKELRQLPMFPEFLNYINSLAPQYLVDTEVLGHQIQYLFRAGRYFKTLLEKTMPPIAFVVCYYGLTSMAFVMACYELGVKSIDIQHGDQSEQNFAYGRWNNTPPEGYALLPTVFWCWSEWEAEVIRKWNNVTPNHQPIVGGNMWLHMWETDNSITKHYDQIVRKNHKFNRYNLLLTLQTDVEVPAWVLNTIRTAPAEWTWWIRVHPSQALQRGIIREKLSFFGNNVELDAATDLPLPALLRNMDMHITGYSSTTIEAANFNLPTVLFDPAGEDLHRRYIEAGNARYVTDSAEMMKALGDYLVVPKGSSGAGIENMFSAETVLRRLETIGL